MNLQPGNLLALEEAAARIPPGHRRAAVALLLMGEDAARASVLLMRRAEREGDRWSGQISLPGGHMERTDRDLCATACRETYEEVGIELPPSALLGALPPLQAVAAGRPLETTILPLVFPLEEPPTPSLGPEAREAFWFPLEQARSGALDSRHHTAEGTSHPAWDFEGRRIWGLTYRILSCWLMNDPAF